jgi:hypothetical protein
MKWKPLFLWQNAKYHPVSSCTHASERVQIDTQVNVIKISETEMSFSVHNTHNKLQGLESRVKIKSGE